MESSAPVAPQRERRSVLLVRCGTWYCALPVAAVIETCRPLPLRTLQGVPAFVRGLVVLRGKTTPVLHLGALLAGGDMREGRRLVSVRVNDKPLALEVDEVVGVRRITTAGRGVQPLVSSDVLQRLGQVQVVDGDLVAWLDTTQLVQDELLDLLLAEGWG